MRTDSTGAPFRPSTMVSRATSMPRARRLIAAASLPAWCASAIRSEEHTSELQSLMRISYAVFCLKIKKIHISNPITNLHISYHVFVEKKQKYTDTIIIVKKMQHKITQ